MLPTFAELAGVPLRERCDGISMLPTLLGRGEQKQHDFLYWERSGNCAVR
jgi:arylsulfatase A